MNYIRIWESPKENSHTDLNQMNMEAKNELKWVRIFILMNIGHSRVNVVWVSRIFFYRNLDDIVDFNEGILADIFIHIYSVVFEK